MHQGAAHPAPPIANPPRKTIAAFGTALAMCLSMKNAALLLLLLASCDERLPFSVGSTELPSGRGTATSAGGDTPLVSPDVTLTATEGQESDGFAGPRPVTVDLCDDSSFSGVAMLTASSAHFLFNFLPGTAAEEQIETIAANRERAYANIRTALGISAEPVITVYLSPNRVAAAERKLGTGVAWPGADRYDVIYTGAPDSFESSHFGHELTHVLAYYLDPAHTMHLPFLDEGIAQLLDQSGIDLHRHYAQKLNAGTETRVRLTSFEWSDIWGDNYGRSGSFAQYFLHRFGWSALAELYRSTFLRWQHGCWATPEDECLDSPGKLAALLGGAVTDITGVSWAELEQGWRAAINEALEDETSELRATERAEIENLVALMDRGISNTDADEYRSTMEGFYCDWGGEDERQRIATRAVEAFATVQSRILTIYPSGVANFPTASVLILREEGRGVSTALQLQVEHLPVGWRITWSSDWY